MAVAVGCDAMDKNHQVLDPHQTPLARASLSCGEVFTSTGATEVTIVSCYKTLQVGRQCGEGLLQGGHMIVLVYFIVGATNARFSRGSRSNFELRRHPIDDIIYADRRLSD
jgi:hypothetical protein